MQHLKTHYEVREYGTKEALEAWRREELTPGKVKFCDGLMLSAKRSYDFTNDTESVDCKHCQKKIQKWFEHGFKLPW